jgi:hypothetical protein
MNKRIKFYAVTAAIILYGVFIFIAALKESSAPQQAQINIPIIKPEAGSKEAVVPVPAVMPESNTLAVPFTPQAPTGNWDALHNEACEEASAIMANAFLTGSKTITLPAAQVEEEITGLTKWQDENLGYHKDTTAAETAAMITGFYGLKTKLIENYSLSDIKKELNLGHIIILPVNGQEIGNPYYKQPGPIYHMLVIRGYNSAGLITNDSGTKRGLNYNYTFNTLYQAGADWNHLTKTIDQTKKIIIVVEK